jgi:ankyrin repeat protein
MLPQQEALAYPTLGNLFIEIPQPEKNIWAAAFKGDIDEIRWELKKSVSVNLKAKCGLAPLHIATLANHPAAVKLLLENGADVSLADSEGNTALHMASFLVRTEIVRLLMKSGADETQRNHRGFSSIDNLAIKWSAGLEEYYHHIERKLQIKLDLNQIRRERPKTLRLLVSESLSTLDQTPDVSLWQAAITGNTAAVEQHILAGTDINAKEDFGGSTPLILAAIFGQEQVVAILIEAGADLNARNNTGGTAIHQACFFCRPAILEQLLKAGADPWVVNGYGLTPLGVVTREWNTELKGIYFYIYKSLHLPFDSESVRRTRDEIAETLKRFRDS